MAFGVAQLSVYTRPIQHLQCTERSYPEPVEGYDRSCSKQICLKTCALGRQENTA